MKRGVDRDLEVSSLSWVRFVGFRETHNQLYPVVYLYVLVRGIEMEPRRFILFAHVVATWQLHIEFHLCGSNVTFPIQITKQIPRILYWHVLASCSRSSLVVWYAAARYYSHCAAGKCTGGWPVCSLFEQLHFADGFHPMDSLLVAEVLDVFCYKDLDSVALHLCERRELEGNGNLSAKWERFSRNNNIVMQLIFPASANSNGLDLFQGSFRRCANQDHFLGAKQIRAECSSSLDCSFHFVFYRAEIDIDGLWEVAVEGKLEVVHVLAGLEGPVPFLRDGRSSRR